MLWSFDVLMAFLSLIIFITWYFNKRTNNSEITLSENGVVCEEKLVVAECSEKLETATQQCTGREEVSTAALDFSVTECTQEIKDPPVSEEIKITGIVRNKTQEPKPPISASFAIHEELQIRFRKNVPQTSVQLKETDNDTELPVPIPKSPEGRRVVVPRPDDETFTAFFESISRSPVQTEPLEVTEEDLDSVIRQSGDLLVTKKTVKVQRKHTGTTRNPIKALAARTDIQNEYTEVDAGFAEREKTRLNVEKLAKHSPRTIGALAGLANKENIAAISLKRTTSSTGSSFLPYKDLMLLHIKGNKHVQTRLVEPVASSINKGDNYILVTPTQVYNYVGPNSNSAEQLKGVSIAQNIQQNKDLGCKCTSVVTINEEMDNCTKSEHVTFWKLLGSTPDENLTDAGHPDEDEIYESAIIETNMIYELIGDKLVPNDSICGTIPEVEILDSSKVLVFDFGSEMYIWSGKNVPLEQRKIATKLAKEIWNNGYNYLDYKICPINTTSFNDSPVDKKSNVRPDWALFAKITQSGETILFREKFLNWPDFAQVIKVKHKEVIKSIDTAISIKPCDVATMRNSKIKQPDLILEGSHVGRGISFFHEESNRYFDISTLGVTSWHIVEHEYKELPEKSVGQFYNGDSYVVKWRYMIRDCDESVEQSEKERCAYFYWQGQDASLNEKGSAALLTVELNQENGPEIRVTQGAEPSAFLNLFTGTMTIHMGRRNDVDERKSSTKLYMCRGDKENEAHLIEVPCSMRHLRSRASFILINTDSGSILIWHGAKTTKNTRNVALAIVDKIKLNKPEEFGFDNNSSIDISEMEEGDENEEFSKCLGNTNQQLYFSLLNSMNNYDYTPRLFHLSSVSGVFKPNEIQCPHHGEETTPYPFTQGELYSANQPALFLLDNGHELWLWQGWWPEMDSDSDSDRPHSDQTGSGQHRWHAERRAAMQTTLDYWQGPTEKIVPAYLVWAGLEPLQFTNLFPTWTDRDDIAELNSKHGRKRSEVLMVANELANLSQSTYPLARLLQRPLPEGIDPTQLEDYLSSEDFVALLGMTKSEFQKLPMWKQTSIKKENGLF